MTSIFYENIFLVVLVFVVLRVHIAFAVRIMFVVSFHSFNEV